MTTTQVDLLEDLLKLTPTQMLEWLVARIIDETLWHLQGFYGRLGVAALESGLVTSEGTTLAP